MKNIFKAFVVTGLLALPVVAEAQWTPPKESEAPKEQAAAPEVAETKPDIQAPPSPVTPAPEVKEEVKAEPAVDAPTPAPVAVEKPKEEVKTEAAAEPAPVPVPAPEEAKAPEAAPPAEASKADAAPSMAGHEKMTEILEEMNRKIDRMDSEMRMLRSKLDECSRNMEEMHKMMMDSAVKK